MKFVPVVVGLAALAFVAVFFARRAMAGSTANLPVGASAPPFSLPGSDGKTHALADHLGKRAVVVAWFPKAFTGG